MSRRAESYSTADLRWMIGQLQAEVADLPTEVTAGQTIVQQITNVTKRIEQLQQTINNNIINMMVYHYEVSIARGASGTSIPSDQQFYPEVTTSWKMATVDGSMSISLPHFSLGVGLDYFLRLRFPFKTGGTPVNCQFGFYFYTQAVPTSEPAHAYYRLTCSGAGTLTENSTSPSGAFAQFAQTGDAFTIPANIAGYLALYARLRSDHSSGARRFTSVHVACPLLSFQGVEFGG